jgi:transposase
MPAPYSYDLRCRVIDHYEKHKKIELTREVFNISRSIIYDWIKLKKETGDVRATEGYQQGYGHKINDLSYLSNLVQTNSGLTLTGIVEKLGNNMSIMTVSRALKKLNITRKKRHTVIKNVMSKNAKTSQQI